MTKLARTPAGSGKRALVATLLLAADSAHREGVDLSLSGLGERIRTLAAVDPFQAVTTTVLVSSALFFAAERGVNEKVRTFGDALAYCATSLSVGYHDIFPRTEAGKAITGLLHTLGPALSARALDAPHRETQERDAASSAHDRAVLGKLEEIAKALRERA
jgi:voltage-gated potassium channel